MEEKTIGALEESLISILDKTISGVEKGVEFLSAELPEVINQLLLWHFTRSLIFLTAGVIGIVVVTYITTRIYKAWVDGGKNWGGMEVIGIFYILIYLPFIFMLNLKWLQIWIAPKVWLIEYTANLIK